MLSAGTLTNPGKLSALLDAARSNLTLDQGWDLTSLAAQLQTLNPDALSLSTIPTGTPSLDTPDGQAVQVDPTRVQAYARTLTTPAHPTPGADGDRPSAHAPAAPAGLLPGSAPQADPRDGGGPRRPVWTIADAALAHPRGAALAAAAAGCVN